MKRNILKLVLIMCLLLPLHTNVDAQETRFSMSYLYFGSPNSYDEQVAQTKGSLNVVTPSYFDIQKDGSLLVTEKLQKSFINEMHEQGIKVVPFLSNHWDKESGENALLTYESRLSLANDIADAVKKYNLDGVNVDIEGVGNTSQRFKGTDFQEAFTDFVRILRIKIPKNKEVSVAVAANPNGWKTGWHGFYDYKELSRHADYLMIMAYDESWEGTPDGPGPVASISFVERSIQYALKEDVPNDKIVLGLPFYGRTWKMDGPTVEGKVLNGRGVSVKHIEPLVKKYGGTITFDEEKQSPKAEFTIPVGEQSYAGSLKLTAGNYIMWFENAQSLKAKLRLINEYDLKGAGSWSLYQESPEMWDYYSLFLNGRMFTDIYAGHWAEDEVLIVNQNNWMNGTSATHFSPDEPLTRAQGAVVLVRALGLDRETPNHYYFTDINGHWAKDAIEVAREYGLVDGVGQQKFDPEAPLTREQLATVLQNIFKYEVSETDDPPFRDIIINEWSYEAILAMKQNDIITGFDDGTFRQASVSSRVQMAALMSRLSDDFTKKREILALNETEEKKVK